jgi:serine/threonine-protein kinase
MAPAAAGGVSMLSTIAAGGTSPASDEGRFPSGTVLAERYRILGFLGRGGMGEVYRAFDLKLDQIVALKFLPAAASADARLLERFRAEVRLARQVSHRNACRVHDIGDADGAAFISMEYVDGDTLANLLKQIGRLPGDKALEIARKLCAGLAAAHERGVLHRDLKPGNIMLDRQGQVRIMDFGLAAAAGGVAGGEIRSGTPAYMAPEQKEGREVTVRSDIYSLGLVFSEMFTGQKVKPGSRPSAGSADLDPAVEKVIQRCLDPNPRNRPSSAIDVARMLPGGDPMAEALAAGDTPSPEMVAASRDTGVLSVRAAIACLLFVLIGLVPALLLSSRANLLHGIPLPDSPEILARKARDIAVRMGYPAEPADTAYGFMEHRRFKLWAEDNMEPADYRALITRGQPPGILFWYRQSPEPLMPSDAAGDVSMSDPPHLVPLMASAGLDPEGRLVYFEAVPPEEIGPPRPVDWTPLFEAARLNAAEWTPATPQWDPLMRFDEQAAWTGTFAHAPNLPMRIEAASWRGRPVSFEVRGSWIPFRSSNLPRVAIQDEQVLRWLASVVAVAVLVLTTTGTLFLAWRNIRNARSDMRAAFRLGAVMLGLSMIAWLFGAHHALVPEFIEQSVVALSWALLVAAVPSILYIALEPYVRRRWPQSLISWTRLFSGGLRDSVVAGHLLLGLAWGVGIRIFAAAVVLARESSGGWLELPPVSGLIGPIRAVGAWARGIEEGVIFALVLFLVVFLLRVVLRRTWLAVAAVILLNTLLISLNPGAVPSMRWFTVALAALLIGVTAINLVRFGVLTVVVSFALSAGILTDTAFGGDLSAWYAPTMYLAVGIVAALALWSFRHALGGRRVVTGTFLED